MWVNEKVPETCKNRKQAKIIITIVFKYVVNVVNRGNHYGLGSGLKKWINRVSGDTHYLLPLIIK